MRLKLLDRDRIRKIAAGEGGIPVKKFEEDPAMDRLGHYLSLLEHHEAETEVLYQMLQEACVMLERQQAVITAVGQWQVDKDDYVYNPDAGLERAMAEYWSAERKSSE